MIYIYDSNSIIIKVYIKKNLPTTYILLSLIIIIYQHSNMSDDLTIIPFFFLYQYFKINNRSIYMSNGSYIT